MVRAVELEGDLGAPGTVSLARSRATREEGDAFLDMTFEEALEWFRAKQIMEVAQFDALRDRFRQGGFSSRVITSNALRDRTKRALDRSLQGELTLRDFITQLRADEIGLGITPTSDHALRNIARTNVASSYGAGKYEAMADPDVAALRPYYEYLTARDSRVRHTHRLLEGRIFEVESEAGRLYFPPLGFQCRCAPRSLSERQLRDRPVSGVIPGLQPDPGFRDPPAPLAA